MPFAGYKDFTECVRKNSSKSDPKAYCAEIKHKAESKEAMKGKTAILAADEKESLMPREVKVTEVFDTQEAEFNDEAMTAKVTIIRSGKSKNRRNYSSSVLREAVSEGIFSNMRMFVDHSRQLPLKRSLKEMVSATTSTEYEEDAKGGKITSLVKFFNKDFFDFAKAAKEYMGDSINARLRTNVIRQPDGSVHEDVQKILKGYSVDWVLYPAAGGQIDQFFESEGDATVADVDWEKVDEDMLKEHAPDLYSKLIEKGKTEAKVEAEPDDDDDDEKDDEKDDADKAITKESVQEMISASRREWEQEQEDVTKTVGLVASAVDSEALPDVVKSRIKKSFEGVRKYDEKAVKTSISEAKEELKKLGLGPRITGMGVSGPAGDEKKGLQGPAQEAVMSVFGMGKQKADAKTEAVAAPGK